MRRTCLLARFCLATVLAIGCAAAWSFVALWLADLVLPPLGLYYSLGAREDGSLVLYHGAVGYGSLLYENLQGEPVDVPEREELLKFVFPEAPWLRGTAQNTADWTARIRSFSDMRQRPNYWYFVSDGRKDGTGYFVGYQGLSKERIGFLGTDGFHTNAPAVEACFPFDGGSPTAVNDFLQTEQFQSGTSAIPVLSTYRVVANDSDTKEFDYWKIYLQSDDHRIYEIDLRQRVVRLAYEAPKIVATAMFSKRPSGSMLAVRTDREVVLLDRQLQVARKYVIPDELLDRDFEWAEVRPGAAIVRWVELTWQNLDASVYHVLAIDARGQVSSRETVSIPDTDRPRLKLALAGPSLVVQIAAVGVIYPIGLLECGSAQDWPEAIWRSAINFWPGLLLVTVLSVLLAIDCARRQSLYCTSRADRILWPLFVFIGGLPAWVAYRYGCRWPVLERCAECRSLVPRDRELCPRCRQEFARPELSGAEILAY